jgi:DNA-binding response OmpR family regulator
VSGVTVKILLLEDDAVIAEQIKAYFELCDHKVDLYDNGLSLVEHANPASYDIMLLDINTPGLSGLEVLKEFRDLSIHTPAIFVTAMSDMQYLKEAYGTGCNDYVRKPFDIEELELRIERLVKATHTKHISISENYTFDMKEEKLYHKEREVHLNEKERSLLYLLLKNRSSTVSKEMIKTYVWDDQDVCDNTLRTKIKKLRDKLDENFIQSLRGAGYKIDA